MFQKKYILPLVSLVMAIFIANCNGDKWEPIVRTYLYRIINDSIPVYATEMIDDNGIPYVDYKTLNGVTPGKQYNPTIVCNYAIDYHKSFLENKDSSDLQRFFNCTDWLTRNLAVKGDHALYIFNWQQPWYDSVKTPYTSGMTSGLAIKVFSLAYHLTGDTTYLQYARLLVNGFYVPLDRGGFTYKDTDGWWYEELADTAMHTPRILDGHIFAITGLHAYAALAKNDSAVFLINKGTQALKSRLHLYDIGNGWSYYDIYRSPADRKYHRILTDQMKELYEMTGDTFFLDHHKKWNEPLSRTYTRRIIGDGNLSGIILLLAIWAVSWFSLWGLVILLKPAAKA